MVAPFQMCRSELAIRLRAIKKRCELRMLDIKKK